MLQLRFFLQSLPSLFLIFLLLLVGCSSFKKSSDGGPSKEEIEKLKELQRQSLIHKEEFWKEYRNTSTEKRLFNAPSELIEYLVRDNKVWGFSATPKAYSIGSFEKEIFKEVIKSFPLKLRKMMKENMVAVFVVEDLGSSALTDGIRAFPKKSFMVFDRKVFQKKANEWCTWKENTPFKGEGASIKCHIRRESENNIKGAFQYIFAHELAHVFNRQDKSLLPFWDDEITDIKIDKYPFLNLSWSKGKDAFIRKLYEDEYKAVRYYSDQNMRLDYSRALPLYKRLSKSQFPSLYGVTNVWDDFAEGFVIYYHTQVLKKPFSITIKDGTKEFIFKSCLQNGGCQKKKEIFKKIFQN